MMSAYTASLVFCLAVIRWQLIRDGGGKGDHYNAILGDQIEVAREVDGFSSQDPIDMRVTYWNDRKDTFPVLCELLAAQAAEKPTRRVVIRFRDAFAGDSRVVVESFPISGATAAPD